VDVFTPVVDDPYTFGEIAAANSVSDIYAMGGIPLTALSIVCFPIKILSHKVMTRMLQGGIDKMKEAGAVILGGHSIKDNGIKFGFSVTGLIDPARIITNDKARRGDLLILTKPLGTGVISFASKMGKASEKAIKMISRSMTELNKVPAEILQEMDILAATDVTGFGLMGHLSEMASQSRVKMEVYTDQVPFFPEALEYLKRKMISGAIEQNKEYASRFVRITSDVPEEMETILYDPQTSGGLLIAVEEKKGDELIRNLHSKGIKYAEIIGRVVADSKEGQILLKKNTSSISII
jgi:selenide,water dikinase